LASRFSAIVCVAPDRARSGISRNSFQQLSGCRPFRRARRSREQTETTSKEHLVKKLWITAGGAALAVTVIVSGAFAAATIATKVVPFTAKYSGTAVTKQTDSIVDISANGTGTATLIGAGKVTGLGKGDSSVRPCVPFNGTGSMTGPGGVLTFKVNPGSAGCGDDSGQLFSITGKALVIKATGKLAKAKGTLKMTGTYDRSSGAFSVKFSGSLTK
jgi:hypothetical protein